MLCNIFKKASDWEIAKATDEQLTSENWELILVLLCPLRSLLFLTDIKFQGRLRSGDG